MPKDEQKKGGLGLMIGLGPGPGEGDDGAKEMAAQEMMDAMSDSDAKGFASAFKEMYRLCKASEEEGEGNPGGEGDEY